MTDIYNSFEDEEVESAISSEELDLAKKNLADRCQAAGIAIEEEPFPGEETILRIGMKCGRNIRWLNLWPERIVDILSISFEKYVFLSNLEAVCSYQEGTIEAGIRPITPNLGPASIMYRRLFGLDRPNQEFSVESAKLEVTSTQEGLPTIEISAASEVFLRFSRPNPRRMTLKLTNCHAATHDSALALLNKVAGSVLFQLDLLTDVPMTLERERRRFAGGRRPRRRTSLAADFQYPKTEFHSAPLSLYWYARSAIDMPLLQFLAFYQVIEFYFPIYSQSEAHRKLKAILKDPTFRGDRDTDIARLLAAIHISRSGTFGDERSQLRATLMECIDSDALRDFLEVDAGRKEFFLNKAKSLPYKKISLASPTADLRSDVADRVYDIRCKIVHTKADSKDGSVELLLPFSPEAEQLSFDIELVQRLAQLVLIAGSTPLHGHV
ncbi:MAG TPA: hypothetical protein VLB76_22145 [Thermoanaerobaculia bacterium]|jgi:hypothetical protein|nr:hypothetical protein [Thermoanaerobaculia bacterium]